MWHHLALSVLGAMVGCVPYDRYHEDIRSSSMQAVEAMADATAAQFTTDNEQIIIDTALSQVRNSLKDPDSALFKNVRLVDYFDGKVICGDVNAKNSYGGYVGYTPFVAGVNAADIWFDTEYVVLSEASNAGLISACMFD